MREHKGDLRNHRVSNAFVAHVQGVSQITLQTQNAISPEIMLVFPQKFHCITVRSYLTTY